jgi:hypothetical protein
MSSLDLRTRLLIEPSLHYIYNENNCHRKIAKFAKHLGDYPAAKLAHEEQNGCNLIQSKVIAETDHLIFRKCLCKTFDPNIYHLLEIYKAYKKGALPFAGGFLDQPAIMIEIINTIDITTHEIEFQETQKQQKKGNKK